jgi:hypothetical protein
MFIESVHVEDWEWVDSHAYYRLAFKLSTSSTTSILFRRYSQFRALDATVAALHPDRTRSDALPKLPPAHRFTWSAIAPSTDFLDARTRDLDLYLQQILTCFGGKHAGFWNDPEVVRFFTDDNRAALLDGQHDKEAEFDRTRSVDWEEWERQLARGQELLHLLLHTKAKPEDNHVERMQRELGLVVDRLHKQLQHNSATAPDVLAKWKALDPLVEYRERNIGQVASPPKPSPPSVTINFDHHAGDQMAFQDKQLDMIGDNVSRLKQLSMEMHEETSQQNELLKGMDKLADNARTRTKAAQDRVTSL